MATLALNAEDTEAVKSIDVSELTGLMDVDSHEMMPTYMWPDAFGEEARPLMNILAHGGDNARRGENILFADESVTDTLEATLDNVWTKKGVSAPGAMNMERRPEVMDIMGVARQLMFPSFGALGVWLYYNPDGLQYFDYNMDDSERLIIGRAAINAHNGWVATRAAEEDRVRPVGFLVMDDLESAVTNAEQLLASGVRAIGIAGGTPPAGLSPADTALDPIWSMMEKAGVPLCIHLGTEFSLLASNVWDKNVPVFKPADVSMLEFSIQPHAGAIMNFTSENFLAAMVLGGVFERFPDLRFGCIEVGAQWIGPFAERLDLWATEFRRRMSHLSMRPSEYLNRNVRVTPFVFEDTASYFVRYPHLSDMYCYASDYPHVEGGTYSKQRHYVGLRELGGDVVNKFFVENGAWLLPD